MNDMFKSLPLCAICFVVWMAFVNSAAIPEDHERQKRETVLSSQAYLMKFGYIDEDSFRGRPSDQSTMRAALLEFQIFNHLPTTGELDEPTLERMAQPRCGVKDIVGRNDQRSSRSRPANFAATPYKWPKNTITWNPTIYSHQMSEARQWWELRYAFDFWEKYSPLKFKYSNGAEKADIEIKFVTGNHGDGVGNSFDGRGGILAHAFYPGIGDISGDAHFDNAEQWTAYSKEGTNLRFAAAHEFGHALGLDHTSVEGALMAPYIQEFDPDFELHQDDIRGIQKLYGAKERGGTSTTSTTSSTSSTTTSTTATTTTTRTTKRTTMTTERTTTTIATTNGGTPPYCDMKFDAVTLGSDGKTYIFRHHLVYRITALGLEPGFPKPTRDVFEGAPIRIGAAAYVEERKQIFFFKGSRVWRYTEFKLDEGFPKVLPRFPEYPHAALTMQTRKGARSQLYLFGRDKFWEWNFETERIIGGYPVLIKHYWRGVPDGVEAAVTWYDGFLYFFKGKKYRKFDKYYRTAMKTQASAPSWLGGECGSAAKIVRPPLPGHDSPPQKQDSPLPPLPPLPGQDSPLPPLPGQNSNERKNKGHKHRGRKHNGRKHRGHNHEAEYGRRS